MKIAKSHFFFKFFKKLLTTGSHLSQFI